MKNECASTEKNIAVTLNSYTSSDIHAWNTTQVQSMRGASAILARIDRRFASRKSNSGTEAAALVAMTDPPEDEAAALWGPETSAVDGDDGELLRSERLGGAQAAAVAPREEAALLRTSSSCCIEELTCPTRSSSWLDLCAKLVLIRK